MSTDNHRLIGFLSDALDLIGAALHESGGQLEYQTFDEALDVALREDEAVQEARKHLSGMNVDLELEEVINAYTARCAEAALKIGIQIGRAEIRKK